MRKLLVLGLTLILSDLAYSQGGKKSVDQDAERTQRTTFSGERVKGEIEVDGRLNAIDDADSKTRAVVKEFPTMSLTMVIDYPIKLANNMTINYSFKGYECASVMNFEKNRYSGIDRMIMDFKEGKSIILSTDKKGKKTGVKMDMKGINMITKSAVAKEENNIQKGESSLQATEETKIIEGYKCMKYLHEGEKYTSEIWVTQDAKLDAVTWNNALVQAFANTSGPSQNAYMKLSMKGIAIQTHMIPKDGRSQECTMTMKNIKPGVAMAEMFSTQGYDVTEMPSVRTLWDEYKKEN